LQYDRVAAPSGLSQNFEEKAPYCEAVGGKCHRGKGDESIEHETYLSRYERKYCFISALTATLQQEDTAFVKRPEQFMQRFPSPAWRI
jgi:hypothetical protein